MVDVSDKNADQLASWGGSSGHKWAARQQELERLYTGVTEALLKAATLKTGERVLDIGCGTGDSSFAALRQVGSTGHVLGADISAPMLGRARERIPAGAPVEFVEADATLYAFPPTDADILISRFGVMFFAEPVVAFANMRKGLKPGGRVAFICWRDMKLNPYFTVPLDAAFTVVLRPEPTPSRTPGPFAFAEEAYLQGILSDAGFRDVRLTRLDLDLDVADGGGLDAAVLNVTEIGPTSRVLAEQTADIQQAVLAAVRKALAARLQGNSVPLAAAMWIATATNPG